MPSCGNHLASNVSHRGRGVAQEHGALFALLACDEASSDAARAVSPQCRVTICHFGEHAALRIRHLFARFMLVVSAAGRLRCQWCPVPS